MITLDDDYLLQALDAVKHLDLHWWYDVAPSLTCMEAEALAALLSALTGRDRADLIAAHAVGDTDEDDIHFVG